MSEMTDFAQRVASLTDGDVLNRMADKGGTAGKKAGLERARRDLGADLAFSGWRRKVKLGIGWDRSGVGRVVINYRPAGIWVIADEGRRGGKQIKPRRGREPSAPPHPKAVRTPQGFRARSTVGAWGGKGTLKDAIAAARREVPRAAAEQFRAEIGAVVGAGRSASSFSGGARGRGSND